MDDQADRKARWCAGDFPAHLPVMVVSRTWRTGFARRRRAIRCWECGLLIAEPLGWPVPWWARRAAACWRSGWRAGVRAARL